MEFAGIGYSEEQIQLLDVASEFCREKSPIAKVRALIDTESGFDADVWQEMAGLGWLAIAVPEAQGGVGLTLAEVVPVVEQMGRNLLATPFVTTVVAQQALLAAGSAEQQAAWLPRLGAGEVGTLALGEAHGDWDLANITATATRADGQIRLTGTKHFVLWADSAALIVVSVLLDGKPALILVEKSAIPEGALRRETIVDETRRSFALTLDGIMVPDDAVLDLSRTNMALAQIDLATNLLQSAEMCGGAQAAIDYTLDYLRARKQFGKLIGEYQALKHPMVDAYVGYEKARTHLYSAAHSISDQGRGEIAVRMAKAAADGAYSFAADRAIQFHGGFGFTHDCDAGLHRRAAIFHASQYGDAAWQRKRLADLLLA
ncbi:acyl-CoA dehydrogenase family protein [Sphingorhabdus sp.]|jgi:acyl-CoA dehydrogenase|uniref:acyl-CoA dehydrogenase family protein n=1 Tax=Sphingorhabdus sp. TaxID=1902408 RepID=UPI0035B33975